MSEWQSTDVGEIPAEWHLVRLSDLASQIVDGTHFTPTYLDSGIPFLRVTDIQTTQIELEQVKRISEKEHRILNQRCNPSCGDILLSKNGTVGIPMLVNWDWPFSIFVSLCLIKLKSTALSTFMRVVLESPIIAQQIHRRSKQGTVTNLHLEEIRDFQIPLPPLPQQRKIARILTTLDNVIEKTEALIAKYQAIKQGLMHDLFTRGVDATGKLRPPQSEAPALYKQSGLGWIPKEWETQRLGEALRLAGGYLQTGPFGSQLHSYEYVSEGIPVIMPQDITDGRIFTNQIARITAAKASSMARHRLRLNDVVFSRRGDLSRAAAISETEDGWICGTGCFLLRYPVDRLDAKWIARQYVMPHVQRQVDANAVGSTMPSLNNSVMERLLMVMPKVTEQVVIGRRVVAIESVHENLHSNLHKLALTKTGLMQDLLTGKVPVNADEVEEDTING